MIETWKTIKKFENYIISNKSIIKSIKTNKILKQKTNKSGYCEICLCNSYGKKTFLVHRLVAENFLENLLDKPLVNHINGIKNDNNLNNLEYVSRRENALHSFKIGHSKVVKKRKTTTLKDVIEIFGQVEIFYPIIYNNIDYTHLYQISTFGNILNIKRNKNLKRGKTCTLYKDGKSYHYMIELMMKEIFLNKKYQEYKDEVWLDIPDTKYQISNYGNIKSFYRNDIKIIKKYLNEDYVVCRLNKRIFKLHRLVALFFVPNTDILKNIVNHKNGIKTDNRAINLEWCTHKENTKHYYNEIYKKNI